MGYNKQPHLRLVLCWHMHQPQYRNLSDHHYLLPWTYLHGIKDYINMVEFLERHPSIKTVFNFTPILIEQIEDYCQQIEAFIRYNEGLRDPLLAELVEPAQSRDKEHFLTIIKHCLRINSQHLASRFPEFCQLVDFAKILIKNPEYVNYTDNAYFADLVTWYHLAWMPETTLEKDSLIKQLLKKGRLFSMHERMILLKTIQALLESIIPRYANLRKTGQIELSVSPYSHPIMPLLINFKSARESQPSIVLPEAEQYPDGVERCRWQIQKAIDVFKHAFGGSPIGCWPSEGAICMHSVKLLGQKGFRWIASGNQVLRNSKQTADSNATVCSYRPYVLPDSEVRCFFRDDRLSDLIGFTYQNWHADDAVSNFIVELEKIASRNAQCSEIVVPIILDGENCWEYYPKNGNYFLEGLYKKLSEHPFIETCTFKECLDAGLPSHTLPNLVAGSWVYGNLSTWIGHEDKNKAWGALVAAKRVYDETIATNKLTSAQLKMAKEQLAVCEGSDWFWWLGDYNPTESVHDFETLFREHLANLYRFLGQEIPEYLTLAMSHGTGTPKNDGVMRVSQE